MPTILERIQHGWNAFINGESSTTRYYSDLGPSSGTRLDKVRSYSKTDRSMVTALYNRIAIDVAAIDFRHVIVDENETFVDNVTSGLNYCLRKEANLDQSGRELIQDIAYSMCDDGVIALCITNADLDPLKTGSFDIEKLRVGKIVQWYPEKVLVNLYDETSGTRKDVLLPKSLVAIIENPLYATMNGPNSTLQRIIRKLALLDAVDEQAGSGKLDLIIQLPYAVKGEARRQQAENRRKDMELQLTESKYGVAYLDATEKITQINRPLENNLLKQIEYLMDTFYSQMGICKEIFDGTANEALMLNYYNRTIEPFCAAITDSINRKFFTKNAYTRGHRVIYTRDPFRIVPVSQLADIANSFTRNEILTANEVRAIIGFRPAKDPNAEALRNSNMPAPEGVQLDVNGNPIEMPGQEVTLANQNEPEEEVSDADIALLDAQDQQTLEDGITQFDEFDKILDELEASL